MLGSRLMPVMVVGEEPGMTDERIGSGRWNQIQSDDRTKDASIGSSPLARFREVEEAFKVSRLSMEFDP